MKTNMIKERKMENQRYSEVVLAVQAGRSENHHWPKIFRICSHVLNSEIFRIDVY